MAIGENGENGEKRQSRKNVSSNPPLPKWILLSEAGPEDQRPSRPTVHNLREGGQHGEGAGRWKDEVGQDSAAGASYIGTLFLQRDFASTMGLCLGGYIRPDGTGVSKLITGI